MIKEIRLVWLVVGIIGCLALATSANALAITDSELAGLTWNITSDPVGDAAGGGNYEIYGMGYAVSGNTLYVVVQTGFDVVNGRVGVDTYGTNYFSAGDLYINVGGTFQDGTGTEFGIATTTHGNNVMQAYSTWGDPVTAGRLYAHDAGSGSPMFADGTFEGYENYLGGTPVPPDGDGDPATNSYPTMIRFGSEVAGDVSGVYARSNNSDPWLYDVFYKLDLSAIGYTGESLQLAWAIECGNDAAQIMIDGGEIPEPTTWALLLAGALAASRKKRRFTHG